MHPKKTKKTTRSIYHIPYSYGDRGIFIFPVQLTTSRIGNLTRLIHTLLYVMTIHTYDTYIRYIHTVNTSKILGRSPPMYYCTPTLIKKLPSGETKKTYEILILFLLYVLHSLIGKYVQAVLIVILQVACFQSLRKLLLVRVIGFKLPTRRPTAQDDSGFCDLTSPTFSSIF